MYILFDQECEQALCGSERAQTAQTTVLERHCLAKWFSQILQQNGVTYLQPRSRKLAHMYVGKTLAAYIFINIRNLT